MKELPDPRAKFIQILGVLDKLYALDDQGTVWVYDPNFKMFMRLGSKRALK